jgi:hypothetical protein
MVVVVAYIRWPGLFLEHVSIICCILFVLLVLGLKLKQLLLLLLVVVKVVLTVAGFSYRDGAIIANSGKSWEPLRDILAM